ncbi:hypothetical protein AB1L88_14745 [Tautonia sp. JC769]|uniref:hypothetical protein n=1 Tax=Tautonia sp. JC769 TaxID=3232135 RepID=UPI00345742EE
MRAAVAHARRGLRQSGPLAALLVALLVGFSGLVSDPGALIVDGERSWIDEGYRPGKRPIGNDLTGLFLPRFLWQSEHWRQSGTIPRWDPRGFAGRPNAGNPQAGLWYPPVWLAWSWGGPSALGWLTVLHLLWLGLGGFALARVVGLGLLAATVTGVSVMMNPYIIAQVIEGHLPHVWSVSWYPWALLGALLLRTGRRPGGVLLSLGLGCSVMTGHPQEGVYLGLALAGWAAWDALTLIAARRRRGRETTRPTGEGRDAVGRLARWGVAFLLALGLSAVEWVPALHARPWAAGPMGGEGGGGAGVYHLWPSNLMQLVSPRALGGPFSYFGRGNLWETMVSFGWAPLVLMALGIAAFPDRRSAWGWSALLGLGLWFAGGRSLGLAAVVAGFPGMEAARVPARSLFLAATAAAVLAGMGVQVLGSAVDRRRSMRWVNMYGRVLAVVVACVLVGLVGSLMAEAGEDRAGGAARSRWLLACEQLARDELALATIAAVGAVLCWSVSRRGDGERTAIVFAGIVILELSLSAVKVVPTAPADRFLGGDAVSDAFDRHRPEEPFRVRARDRFYLDLQAWRDDIEKTNINDLFQVRHAAEVIRPLYAMVRESEAAPAVRALDTGLIRAVMDRLGVAFVLADRPLRLGVGPVIETGSRGISRFELMRNPTALPRARMVPGVEIVEPARALPRLAEVDPRSCVVMASDPLRGIEGPRQPYTPAEYEQTHPDRVVIRVTTEAPGLLVVADTWMPGWRATVNGRAVPIDRGDHAFRVVALPEPGRIEVEMTYRAPGLMAGGIISSGTAGLLVLIGVTSLGRRAVLPRD